MSMYEQKDNNNDIWAYISSVFWGAGMVALFLLVLGLLLNSDNIFIWIFKMFK